MKTIIKLLVAFACGLASAFCWQAFADCGVEPQVDSGFIMPTQADIQAELVRLGYLDADDPNATDGVVGRVTRDAWNKAEFNQYAEEHF